MLNNLLQRQIDGVNEAYRKLEEHEGDAMLGFENRKINGDIMVLFPEFCEPAPTIYFPNGTYLVSDTISYTLTNLNNYQLWERPIGMELNRYIRFLGESQEGTIIRLKDNCKGFEFGQKRPVISFIQGATLERSDVELYRKSDDRYRHGKSRCGGTRVLCKQ